MLRIHQTLSRPRNILILLTFVLLLAGLDSFRQPDRQLTARLYIAAVHGYQHYGRSLLAGVVTCRFDPTCSVYSIEAVQKYGIRRGLVLTARRILSCRSSVPLGTFDPVP